MAWSRSDTTVVLGAALLLIVLSIYVNQVGVSLASPLAVLYGVFAVSAAVARRCSSMRSVSMSLSTVRGWRNVDV
jgi:hypothetical protein